MRWLQARDLLRELIARDIKLRYRGSALGIAWTLLNPLAELLVLMFVFSRVMQVGVPNFSAYLFIGLLVYGWFQTSLNFATQAVVGSRELVKRPGVPVLVLPVVTVASNLVHFLLSLPILAVLLWFSDVTLSAAVAALPLLIVIEFLLILAVAYPVAAINVWFRDTQHVLRVLLQLLFYLTPVFYEVSTVPAGLRWFYAINPLTHLVDGYRAIFLHGTLPTLSSLTYLVTFSLVLLGAGLTWYRHVMPTFADEL